PRRLRRPHRPRADRRRSRPRPARHREPPDRPLGRGPDRRRLRRLDRARVQARDREVRGRPVRLAGPRRPLGPLTPTDRKDPSVTAIAFIGLGIMGAPMAVNLAKAGFTVTGYNRTPKYDDLVAAGGTGAGSAAEAVAGADVVAIMVPDSADVAGVLRDERDGVFDH